MLWSNYPHKRGFSNEKATLDILNALRSYVRVKLVVPPNDSLLQRVQKLIGSEALASGQVQIFQASYREMWARDMGPAFVVNSLGQLQMADFNFSAWGYSAPTDSLAKLDEGLDERLADLLKIPKISTDLISEGGDHETNGQGTFILTESVELSRNPTLDRERIEAEFKRVLGAKKIIWLPQGLYEDDHTFRGPIRLDADKSAYTVLTTNGHADEYVRFVNPTTVLLAEVDTNDVSSLGLENARRLNEAYQILSHATDQDGQPLRVLRMPLPHPIVGTLRPGDGVYEQISTFQYADSTVFLVGRPVPAIAAASYLNFLIANGCVLMPRYWQPGQPNAVKYRDEAAQAVLQHVFPDKKIIALDVLAINWGGGGIHCITRNEPASSPANQ
jgi:agmatine deiminase